ncbi:MAG: minor capsid protein [Oscillospiraceae bacterium]|nr:minor capsid protein [Oscillospiraceae bacterium]
MARNNSDYWNDRKQQFSASLAKDEKRLFSKLAAYYEREAAALEKQIAAYYTQYGEGNVLAYRQLLQTLDAAEVQLLMEDCNAFAEKYPEYADFLPVRESIYKLNRLEGLQTSILLQQLEIGAVEQEQLTAFFLKQAARYANFSAELLGFGEQFYRIDSDMVKKVVGNRWCEGKNFSERIWDNRQKLARTLQTEVVNGIIRGENYHTLANNLRQKFTGVSKKQAERLVYTEDTYLSCEAAITPFEKDPSFTQYRFACTMDGSECDICRALHGQTFSIKERTPGTNFPPMHPWCRCFFDVVVPEKKTLTSGNDSGIIKSKKKKYKSKYSDDERVERSKKAKKVCERVLAGLHFDENGKLLDEIVYTASGKEVKIVEKTVLHEEPNSITQVVNAKGGVNRNYYDENGNQFLQISNNGHWHPVEEDIGNYGEHAHDYYFDENNELKRTDARELAEEERKENGDVL